MTENRLDRIERAVEANARAIGALANSIQKVSELPSPNAPTFPLPSRLVSDPISACLDRLDELVDEKLGDFDHRLQAIEKKLDRIDV